MQSYPVADVETDFVPILLSVSIFKRASVFLHLSRRIEIKVVGKK